jgi:Papain-like cysteine protease AvrRpt2
MRALARIRGQLIAVPIVLVAVIAPLTTAAGLGLFAPPAHHLTPTPLAGTPIDNQDHLYVLDGWGGVHPVGSAPALTTTASWPHKDIAQSLGLFPDGTGGYVMDAWGGLHPVGVAPQITDGPSWQDWNIAREVVMAPWSSAAHPAGYVLDGWGGLHAFGGAPAVTTNTTWPRMDIARGVVLTPDSTPDAVKGYTLDGYGGVHPFGGALPVTTPAYWPNHDIARGIVLTAIPGAGYTLDGFGGLHPFGGAPTIASPIYTPKMDMVDGVVAWTNAPAMQPGGWLLDREGGVHAYGSAPSLTPTARWPGFDIARAFGSSGSAGAGGSFEQLYLRAEKLTDAWGAYYNQRDDRWANAIVGPSPWPVWKVGCLIADLAMVYTHFGYRAVTPATIATHAEWFALDGEIVNAAFNIPGHAATFNRRPTTAWIDSWLGRGHPVIIGMRLSGGGTHFITLTGRAGPNDYWTNDPWEQNAVHVTFAGDWFDRGAIYEAIAFS